MAQAGNVLHFSGHLHLRHRLVLSILSGKAVKIDHIRSEDKNPGSKRCFADYEVSLLRLLERITNGTVIEISVTGTAILLKPGVIAGGPAVIMLAPFSKRPLQLTLRGITSDDRDLSADLIRTITLPQLQLFGVSDGLELRIRKRGSPPLGGGEVQFICPSVKQLKTLDLVERGKVKRIRGISHAVRVNPQFSNRMIEAARSVLNRYIPDIYLYSDVYKGEDSGKSPGYGLSLLSETTTGAMHCAEALSQPGVAPEDIALLATRALLQEIQRGGCVDSHHQILVLLSWMGEPTARTIQFLRDVKTAFGTTFKIVPAEKIDPASTELLYSCYGAGYVNANRTLS
ncbi:18S rRNA biogenesis protein [Fomitopsis serialis]|uniref:18S rRNA biogenesis protein n=1 Tax=Fomitopsis serialis TaxID=139415 RepID=UPI002007B68E|nr:18S rRNA biogenesis protein [Neoantrodia serialis]KAH9935039.1 18S rRNA biogenesis protein [Neoantrodia serialis]